MVFFFFFFFLINHGRVTRRDVSFRDFPPDEVRSHVSRRKRSSCRYLFGSDRTNAQKNKKRKKHTHTQKKKKEKKGKKNDAVGLKVNKNEAEKPRFSLPVCTYIGL